MHGAFQDLRDIESQEEKMEQYWAGKEVLYLAAGYLWQLTTT